MNVEGIEIESEMEETVTFHLSVRRMKREMKNSSVLFVPVNVFDSYSYSEEMMTLSPATKNPSVYHSLPLLRLNSHSALASVRTFG